ncbi:hypothetical protein PPERSA_11598 [Pseudocohnilembus persalinus]|uniref:Uncharacterized protein n=1 Tax=Pseudocohnilembus persalinus TaxID=266149 RepID=A0A0V0Q9X8_PSEPJ|nr:hypothetical protein PPERSA_11598 [Pseudocohnilembus persalinus]|eukprot:KRW98997.1 hypothetical protein PPERSA_11598 [Pseudocohnilembus persalinus]
MSQYHSFTNPTISKEQRQKIEEEVKKNLFKLPDEEEIEDNLNKQEQLKKLDEEYQIKKAELEMKKNQLAADKISKLEEEQNRLAKRLEEIINDPEEEEEFEKKIEVIKQRLQVKDRNEKDLKVQKEIDLKRKEHEIEKKVKKKLELERLLERKKLLNQQFEMAQFQYDVIREEEEARNIENITLLERALKRKGLEGNIDEKDKKLIAMTLAGHQADVDKEVEMILEQVQSLKEQKKKEEQMNNKEKQKQLNDKRFQLMQKQEELIKKKAIYNELRKKGDQFLEEMALGNAPPQEFIEKNLQYNDEDYREFRTVEQIVERTKQQIETAQDKIYELRKDLDENQYRYLDEINYYKGELKPLIERMNPESVFIAKFIIDICIDNVLKKEIDDKNLMDAADFKLKYLEEKKQKLEKFEDKQFDQQIMKQIRNEMISRVYKQLALEAGNEIVTINNMAKNKAENIIVRALKQERPINNNVNE